MLGAIAIIVAGSLLMGLFITMFVMKYKSDKESGPMPWHPAYDRARVERVELEKLKNQRRKHPIELQGIDINSSL